MLDLRVLTKASVQVYQYLNFDKIDEFTEAAASVSA